MPIVLREGLGFSVAMSQTLMAPVSSRTLHPVCVPFSSADNRKCYVFGAILGFIQSWLSDKYKTRGSVIIINSLLEIVGVTVLGFAKDNSVRFFGAFMLAGSCTANLPACLTYQSNNITGQWRRAFGSALIVGAGGVGGVIGSLVFRNQDSPHYRLVPCGFPGPRKSSLLMISRRPGLYTCLIAAGLTIVSVIITTIAMARKNAQQKRGVVVIMETPGFTYTL